MCHTRSERLRPLRWACGAGLSFSSLTVHGCRRRRGLLCVLGDLSEAFPACQRDLQKLVRNHRRGEGGGITHSRSFKSATKRRLPVSQHPAELIHATHSWLGAILPRPGSMTPTLFCCARACACACPCPSASKLPAIRFVILSRLLGVLPGVMACATPRPMIELKRMGLWLAPAAPVPAVCEGRMAATGMWSAGVFCGARRPGESASEKAGYGLMWDPPCAASGA